MELRHTETVQNCIEFGVCTFFKNVHCDFPYLSGLFVHL
jgi:hypothetical protein